MLNHATEILKEKWDGKVLEEKARQFCSESSIKVGDYFMVLRLAVTGQTMTPPLWDVLEILGKNKSMARITNVSIIFNS